MDPPFAGVTNEFDEVTGRINPPTRFIRRRRPRELQDTAQRRFCRVLSEMSIRLELIAVEHKVAGGIMRKLWMSPFVIHQFHWVALAERGLHVDGDSPRIVRDRLP